MAANRAASQKARDPRNAGGSCAPAPKTVHLGIDVGSTTTKFVALDPETGRVLASDYRRHRARQAESILSAVERASRLFPDSRLRLAVCGSGGAPAAEALGIPFLQEVVANSIAVRELYPQTRCAIELGGQDAKMVFFRQDEATGLLEVSDMRMNGSCAGGTGAFLDEIATVLRVPVEQFDALASKGSVLYDISGRCGVYAKTDIQPLINQGVGKADIALSSLHAVAKQTIGGLAQGLDIEPPVIFEGGPLTFNPTLVRVFSERLGLEEGQAIVPEHPETMVARGCALSLSGVFADAPADVDLDRARRILEGGLHSEDRPHAEPYFADDAEREAFLARHARPAAVSVLEREDPPRRVRAYLGIDSGSTTTKFALVDEDERLVDEFYSSNEGEPLDVATQALREMHERYERAGVQLDVIACGTTGYGELMFDRAYHADFHTVETVAHAAAATKYVPDATFVLDIGGQDMKAIWLDDGVVSDIVVNEACSSGCGSFLENFASTLGIPVERIAEAAFRSKDPAVLGSRCTVFMNSSIVTEQKNGKTPEDVMAGLCRSIVENVFTKVIRVSNLDSLGDRIVVQGGTFNNDAVLRALERHLGREVVRAPYPGLMGAIGAALLAKRAVEKAGGADSFASTFIGFDGLESFSYEKAVDSPCPFCANHCDRTVMTFADGSSWVTGNRCPRGEVVGDPKDSAVREKLREVQASSGAPNMFDEREKLLFQEWPCTPVCAERDVTIGLPRTLANWDAMPFWTTLFRALGFKVRISDPSTREIYESGLSSVTSDTVCFPAKLVHGHVRNLAEAGVDRVFMPILTTVPSENTAPTSQSMCAVVKGYPMVVRNSDDPQRRYGVTFDDPLFHWYSRRDRDRQLCEWFGRTFGIDERSVKEAVDQAQRALQAFRNQLKERGASILRDVEDSDGWAVVLAGRPYHNDELVNHGLPRMFSDMGVAVLTPDSLPHVTEVDLSNSRLDIVNNFHARMLSSAVIAAGNPHLEFAQIVSFGCGHDAYLTDEIVRMMKEISGKTPLVLKLDESDVAGPLRIRVRSFVETVGVRQAAFGGREVRELSDPYPVKFEAEDRSVKTILVPNTSHAFCRLMSAAFSKQGVRAVPLEIGREEAIRLGKKYVHNDICFPAQMTIGEALAALESGEYDVDNVAIGTGKYIGDCRLTHYGALLRKALDDAGYPNVPIVTNDDVDASDMHPGFKMSVPTAVRIAMTLPMIDVLEELLRKMRPYELVPGSSEEAFDWALDQVIEGLEKHGAHGARRGFERGIERMASVRYDRSDPRPTVLVVGEYLLNFHPGANHDIEAFLEDNGMEVIEARMTDVIRKSYFYRHAQVKEFHVSVSASEAAWFAIADQVFEVAHDLCDKIAVRHPLYRPACRMPQLVKASDPIMHHTFDAGEGVLIPAEILHHAAEGCRAFVILQPFGCLPNHVCGRGIAKRLKEEYPDAQILPLDYDPDVSFANVENRLQMLVMNATLRSKHASAQEADGCFADQADEGEGRGRTAPEEADGRREARGEAAEAGDVAEVPEAEEQGSADGRDSSAPEGEDAVDAA